MAPSPGDGSPTNPFPDELTVWIGLYVKKTSPHKITFVFMNINWQIYYVPTAEQLANVGGTREDSDCLVAPGWQMRYEVGGGDAEEIVRRQLPPGLGPGGEKEGMRSRPSGMVMAEACSSIL